MTHRPRARSFALLASLLLIGAGLSPQDWEDAFRRGYNAATRGRWEEAEQYMRAAIAANPRAGGEVRVTSLMSEPYLPYYWLGRAQKELGDCAGALRSWTQSVAQGAIQRDRGRFDDLASRRTECAAEVLPPLAEAAGARILEAEQQREQVASIGRDPRLRAAWDARPALGRAEQNATQQIQLARDQLTEGMNVADVELLETAAQTATAARDALRGVVEAAQATLDELDAADQLSRAAQRARERIIEAEAAAQRLAELDEAWRQDASLSSREQSAQSRLDEARTSRQRGLAESNVDGLEEAASLAGRAATEFGELHGLALDFLDRRRSTAATKTIESTSTDASAGDVPGALLEAGEAFFNRGDYERTVSILDASEFTTRRQLAQAFLLRAAARYALYALAGSQDEALLEEARDEVLRCTSADATLQPNDAFSPAFRDFFARSSNPQGARFDGV